MDTSRSRAGSPCYGRGVYAVISLIGLASGSAIAAPTPGAPLWGENFDTNPGWDARNNVLNPPASRTVMQDFGYRTSNFAGNSAGEIGGIVDRSPLNAAYYGEILASPLGLGQSLSFSGQLALLKASHTVGFTSSSDIFIGFFNSKEQRWRPQNFLGFRLSGSNEPVQNVASLELNYGTSAWTAGGIGWGQTFLPNGARHSFNVNYNPNIGSGQIAMSWDGGQILTLNVPSSHRAQGATFDRFGIFANQLPGLTTGNRMEAYFDDISINGSVRNFSTNPNWQGIGNQTTFQDSRLYGMNDFGYRTTNRAGGASPGEMGGLLWRVEDTDEQFQAYYADQTVGTLNLNNRLHASGKIAAERFSVDAGVMLGWFNASEQDWPPSSFVGVYMDSLSDTGRLFTPMYGTATGNTNFARDPWLLLPPDGASRNFTIDYDPAGAGGLGVITVRLNGLVKTLTLQPGQKAQGATLNRFGIFNMQDNNGKHSAIYLDDLQYTFAASTSSLTAGDTDLDGDVDLADLGRLASEYGRLSNATWNIGDFDSDGDVDLSDLGALAGQYGAGKSQAFADFDLLNVPEPALGLVLASGILLVRRREGV